MLWYKLHYFLIQGGFYFFHLLDRYAAGYSMLFAVLAETIAVSWIYGTDRFCADIKDMIGFSPGVYWRVCWKFVAPLFLMVCYKMLQNVLHIGKKFTQNYYFRLLTHFIWCMLYVSYKNCYCFKKKSKFFIYDNLK